MAMGWFGRILVPIPVPAECLVSGLFTTPHIPITDLINKLDCYKADNDLCTSQPWKARPQDERVQIKSLFLSRTLTSEIFLCCAVLVVAWVYEGAHTQCHLETISIIIVLIRFKNTLLGHKSLKRDLPICGCFSHVSCSWAFLILTNQPSRSISGLF